MENGKQKLKGRSDRNFPAKRGAPQPPSPLGLYLHIPFCPTLCDFCSFDKNTPDRSQVQRFLETVATEWRSLEMPHPPETWFWGGGTPTLLSSDALLRLGSFFREALPLPTEWTVEAAPSTVNRRKLKILHELGVTRISIGGQSFDASLLRTMGRDHHPKQIHQSYQLAREIGFESVSLDLIFAVPGQSETALRRDLDTALELAPDHLSTYCLTFEEDTALWVRLHEGKIRRSEEAETKLYRIAWNHLREAGFEHYEVSNFARPGHRCHHNVNTWRMHDWIGLGPSAASQWRDFRYQNPPGLEAWSRQVKEGPIHPPPNAEPLSPDTLMTDAIIFGLRMAEGIDPPKLVQRFNTPLPEKCSHLFEAWERHGLIRKEGTRLLPTEDGMLLADRLGVEVLEATEGSPGVSPDVA